MCQEKHTSSRHDSLHTTHDVVHKRKRQFKKKKKTPPKTQKEGEKQKDSKLTSISRLTKAVGEPFEARFGSVYFQRSSGRRKTKKKINSRGFCV